MENKTDTYDIHASLAPKLNLAFYQNSVPILRELVVINGGDEPLKNVELGLISEPEFIKPKNWRIDVVDAGQNYHITNLDLALDGALLGRLTEAEIAQSRFILKADGNIIARLDKQIELLPRNQWGGMGHMPEIIAAFVQPNEPAVEQLLKKAAEILRKHGKSGMLNGYQGGPKGAWELAAAIWSAIGSMGLDYSLPPASFEQTGQKIRKPRSDCRCWNCHLYGHNASVLCSTGAMRPQSFGGFYTWTCPSRCLVERRRIHHGCDRRHYSLAKTGETQRADPF